MAEEIVEELSTEELTEQNDILLQALIDLLVEKKIITEEEFNKKVEEFSGADE
jgi:hypothetical protein